MTQRRRIYYTESQKAIMWDRWQEGESLSQISDAFQVFQMAAFPALSGMVASSCATVKNPRGCLAKLPSVPS